QLQLQDVEEGLVVVGRHVLNRLGGALGIARRGLTAQGTPANEAAGPVAQRHVGQLTGESRPQAVRGREEVVSGSLRISGQLVGPMVATGAPALVRPQRVTGVEWPSTTNGVADPIVEGAHTRARQVALGCVDATPI